MAILKEKKKELISQFQRNKSDSGSPEVQISILTERINSLSNHLTSSPKDFQGQRGLLFMVSKRKKHLNYLREANIESYRRIVDNLNIRN